MPAKWETNLINKVILVLQALALLRIFLSEMKNLVYNVSDKISSLPLVLLWVIKHLPWEHHHTIITFITISLVFHCVPHISYFYILIVSTVLHSLHVAVGGVKEWDGCWLLENADNIFNDLSDEEQDLFRFNHLMISWIENSLHSRCINLFNMFST